MSLDKSVITLVIWVNEKAELKKRHYRNGLVNMSLRVLSGKELEQHNIIFALQDGAFLFIKAGKRMNKRKIIENRVDGFILADIFVIFYMLKGIIREMISKLQRNRNCKTHSSCFYSNQRQAFP